MPVVTIHKRIRLPESDRHYDETLAHGALMSRLNVTPSSKLWTM